MTDIEWSESNRDNNRDRTRQNYLEFARAYPVGNVLINGTVPVDENFIRMFLQEEESMDDFRTDDANVVEEIRDDGDYTDTHIKNLLRDFLSRQGFTVVRDMDYMECNEICVALKPCVIVRKNIFTKKITYDKSEVVKRSTKDIYLRMWSQYEAGDKFHAFVRAADMYNLSELQKGIYGISMSELRRINSFILGYKRCLSETNHCNVIYQKIRDSL